MSKYKNEQKRIKFFNIYLHFTVDSVELKRQIKKALINKFGVDHAVIKETTFEFMEEEDKMVCSIHCYLCQESIKVTNQNGWSLGNFYRHINKHNKEGDEFELKKKYKDNKLDTWVQTKNSKEAQSSPPVKQLINIENVQIVALPSDQVSVAACGSNTTVKEVIGSSDEFSDVAPLESKEQFPGFDDDVDGDKSDDEPPSLRLQPKAKTPRAKRSCNKKGK